VDCVPRTHNIGQSINEVVDVIAILGGSKVETPYHDNNLVLTPIISPQSGWQ